MLWVSTGVDGSDAQFMGASSSTRRGGRVLGGGGRHDGVLFLSIPLQAKGQGALPSGLLLLLLVGGGQVGDFRVRCCPFHFWSALYLPPGLYTDLYPLFCPHRLALTLAAAAPAREEGAALRGASEED